MNTKRIGLRPAWLGWVVDIPASNSERTAPLRIILTERVPLRGNQLKPGDNDGC